MFSERLPPRGDERTKPEDQWYRALDDNAEFQRILEHLGAVVTETDPGGKITYLSRTVEQVAGYTREELMGQAQHVQVHPDDYEEIRARIAKPIEEVGRKPLRWRSRNRDGSWCWIEMIAGTRFVAPDGGVYGVSVSRDVSEIVRMEDALRETADRYTRVVQANDLVLVESNSDGKIVFTSENCERVLGLRAEEIIAQEPFSNVHPDDRSRLRAQFQAGVATGKPTTLGVYRARHKDGRWLWFQSTGVGYRNPSGEQRFLNVTRDITERVEAARERAELAAQMQQAQRLESLGLMAGGVAHDFNNLLTPILGEASLALEDLAEDSPIRRRLERIQKAARRASELTHQMLAYAGADEIEPERVGLSDFVESISRLLETALPDGTSLSLELAPHLYPVHGDTGQLTQVVMNLITNAAEALDPDGGEIVIRTGEVEYADAPPSPFIVETLAPGRYVFVEIEDSGCGMDRVTRDRIFDPFFTTKFTGRGLGLASVLGIMRAHGGSIELESRRGVGTRFRALFPVANETVGPLATDAPAGVSSAKSPGTVLVIDDDDDARDVAAESLAREGIEVLAAPDGTTGVELFEQRQDDIDLVILDRTMPLMSGEETFDRLRELSEDVRVLLMSGYGEKRAAEAFGDRGLAGFVKKPFLPEDLSARVRELLAEP
jgi:PAS domain S-box-containing protein